MQKIAHPITSFSCLMCLLVSTSAAQAVTLSSEQIWDNITAADGDLDQRLSLEEFTTFVDLSADMGGDRARKARALGAYGYAFRRADTNRDGFLDTAEIERGLIEALAQ